MRIRYIIVVGGHDRMRERGLQVGVTYHGVLRIGIIGKRLQFVKCRLVWCTGVVEREPFRARPAVLKTEYRHNVKIRLINRAEPLPLSLQQSRDGHSAYG